MVRVAIALLLGAATAPSTAPAAAAQTARTGSQDAVVRSDELHSAMKPVEALTILEEVLFDDPRNYEVLWRAARESAALAMDASDERTRAGRFRQAETYARLATAAREDGVEGHHVLAVALAGRARLAAPGARLGLLEDLRTACDQVLALEPDHAGGHAALASWHAEIMRLSGLASLVARNVLASGAVRQASWNESVRHLSRAIELEPQALVYHLALAAVYQDTERPDLARAHLRTVLGQPAQGPEDRAAKDQARVLLLAVRDGGD